MFCVATQEGVHLVVSIVYVVVGRRSVRKLLLGFLLGQKQNF